MMPFKVVYMEFPPEIHGIIYGGVQKRKSGFLILIDSLLPDKEKDHVLRHELAHIVLDHHGKILEDADLTFFNRSQIQEDEAEELANRMTDDELKALMQWAV